MTVNRLALILASATVAACTNERAAQFGRDAALERTATACEDGWAVAYVNNPTTSATELKSIGVNSTGANNLITLRDGADRLPGTTDDFLFTSFAQIDAVSYIGDSSVDALLNHVAPACAVEETEEEICDDSALFAWLNDPVVTAADLQAQGISSRAATNVITYRATNSIDDWAELDGISYVGEATMATFGEIADALCVEPGATANVVFSPTSYDQSHLSEVVRQINAAQHSIDIAMYSYNDAGIGTALQNAVDRGVTVRMVFETAATDRSVTTGSTKSSRLEDACVDVRWVNKTMHHKFAIFDGPRTDLAAAKTGTLMSGSGNWSNSAAVKYDENTVILHGDEKLMLHFQQEFNTLWSTSRDYVSTNTIPYVANGVAITDDMIAAADGTEAVFTSDNFNKTTTNGGSFVKVRGRYTVGDALVKLIQDADTSIYIASGHLRSRPIADALIAKHQTNPEVDIKVYLDGQEYISEGTNYYQVVELEECLAAAGTSATKIQDCNDYGFMYAWDVHDAGVPLKFDYYAFRWDATYAEQMHHKYMIVDSEIVATGSYNLSINAELTSLENVMFFTADRYPGLVDAYTANFEKLWVTGDSTNAYDLMVDKLEGYEAMIAAAKAANEPAPHGSFDIVFPPMAVTQPEVYYLKNLMIDVCPAINSTAYKNNPTAYRTCTF